MIQNLCWLSFNELGKKRKIRITLCKFLKLVYWVQFPLHYIQIVGLEKASYVKVQEWLQMRVWNAEKASTHLGGYYYFQNGNPSANWLSYKKIFCRQIPISNEQVKNKLSTSKEQEPLNQTSGNCSLRRRCEHKMPVKKKHHSSWQVNVIREYLQTLGEKNPQAFKFFNCS